MKVRFHPIAGLVWSSPDVAKWMGVPDFFELRSTPHL